MIRELSVLAMLGICSVEDIKSRRISILQLACFAAEGILCWIFVWKQPLAELFMGVFPGTAVLALAFLSRGNIGTGDGLLLMVLGIFLKPAETLKVLICSVFLSAGYALFLYLVKKKDKHYEIPFVPFVFISAAAELTGFL